jgi:hypothetical protein
MPARINFFLELLAVVSFGLTLWLLWNDRTSSAGVSLALGFGAILFRVLPSLESFEILGLKAKLRERIEKADELLEHLRGVATVFTKVSIQNTTWSSRIGGLTYQIQSELLDEQVAELMKLDVSLEMIDSVRRPALAMVSYDLARRFVLVLEKVVRKYEEEYGRVRGALDRLPPDARSAEHGQQTERAVARQKLYSVSRYRDIFQSTPERPEHLSAVLSEVLSLYKLSAFDRVQLEKLAGKLAMLNQRIWTSKRMDAEVGEYLDESRAGRDFEELFPNGPTGPDWDPSTD